MRYRALIAGAGNAGRAHRDALESIGVEAVGPLSGTTTLADPSPLRDPAIDVVHVTTANDLHLPLVREALRSGKHVVCEKPLAGELGSAERLADLARRTGRLTTVCQTYRFLPLLAELAWMTTVGELGPIHLARGSFLQDWLLLAADQDWRLDTSRGGISRTASDIGVHWLDLVETITGQHVEAVAAQLGYLHGRKTEDHAGLLVRFDGGLQGVCTLSQASAGRVNELELSLDGLSASATWRNDRKDELWVGARERDPRVVTRGDVRSPAAKVLAMAPESLNEGRRNLLSAFYGSLDGAAPVVPLPSFEDGLRHVRFAEAVIISARRRAWVSLAEVRSAMVTL